MCIWFSSETSIHIFWIAFHQEGSNKPRNIIYTGPTRVHCVYCAVIIRWAYSPVIYVYAAYDPYSSALRSWQDTKRCQRRPLLLLLHHPRVLQLNVIGSGIICLTCRPHDLHAVDS